MLASSGSDAVETALKTARVATGRDAVLAFEGGYHGLSYGALAVTGFRREFFQAPFRGQIGAHVHFATFGGEIPPLQAFSAVIVEPVQGRGGVRTPPPGWLAELGRRAREAGALLVLDEIFTGFGRTGSLFAFQEEGVRPDLLCLGKGMAAGFPISATLGRAEVMDAWGPSTGEALHTQTFLGNPVGCAMALATLEILEREDLSGRARRLGSAWARALAALPGVTVRGRGLMLGLDLRRPGAAVGASERLLQKGWIVLPCGDRADTLSLVPPLVVEEAVLEAATEAIASVLETS
jgi:4-aminobutyrate aminotransferase-like enzyme